MRGYITFVKKEFFEMARTYKLFLLAAVYFLLGVINPLTAEYTPDLLTNFMPKGMKIKIPEPTAIDSWLQFYKNVPQMGLIILAIVFSGILVSELNKGTVVIMLTKGLSRKTVVLSKFTAAAFVWTAAYCFCFALSYGYTIYFWKEKVPNLIFSICCIWLFGIFLLTIEILANTLCHSGYEVLLFTGGIIVLCYLLNIVPKVQKYNPILLIHCNKELLTKAKSPEDLFWSVGITLVLTVLFLIGSILCFNQKKI